jgi:hypothetical protein
MTQASPARRAAGRGDRPGPPEPGARYGLLLLVLIATYLLSAFSHNRLIDYLQVALFLCVLGLAFRTARVRRRTAQLAGAAALLGSAAATAAALTGTQAGLGAADIWKGLILLDTAVLIVRRVLARPTVTMQSIYGALSAYLIIGLMFAAYYAAIWRLDGGSFFAGQRTAEHQTGTQTFQYFSFTTLTTLGYGDFTAAGDGGRALAVIEALTGQVFLATLVARLVTAFRVPAEQAPRQTVSRRRPRGTVRRGPKVPPHRKSAGNGGRPPPKAPPPKAPPPKAPSPKAPPAQVAQRTGVDDRAPDPGQ